MYRKRDGQPEFENFALPFSGKLSSRNRWVRLSKEIPWEHIEDKYAEQFSKDNMGAPAKSLRMALGALIIKERLAITDEETVEQIRENPYLQYFIGLYEYQEDAPFDPSMMVHFRKRINIEMLTEINELIIHGKDKQTKKEEEKDDDAGDGTNDKNKSNKGKLIIDATCAPADIKYPTDLSLLDDAREKAEKIIDILHDKGRSRKPRTYRNKARRDFLRVAKKKKYTMKELRKALRKQLQYLNRDLKHIDNMIKNGAKLGKLKKKQYKDLLVIHELYRQQKDMFDRDERKVENRIVSISQPHVRPIVRGKAAANTEFGAKITVSIVDGFSSIDHFDWENYNESMVLKDSIEKHKEKYGVYPETVEADKIFRTRDNISYCKRRGIKISGSRLGKNAETEKENASIRNAIEGKFGEGKRKYSLARIMAKLENTSKTVIGLIILVMNLEKRLRLLFIQKLSELFYHSFGRFQKFYEKIGQFRISNCLISIH